MPRDLLAERGSRREEEGDEAEHNALSLESAASFPGPEEVAWRQGYAAHIARPSFFRAERSRFREWLRGACGFWTFRCDFTISPAIPKSTD